MALPVNFPGQGPEAGDSIFAARLPEPASRDVTVTDELPGFDEVVQVLLVDDQPANLDALQASLGDVGCEFVLARSADEALLALLDADYAAVVLDVRMPGMSGLDLAKLIKQRKRTKHVPILFLTAHMLDQNDVLEGYRIGAVDYLTKPIKPEILRSKLSVFIDLHRKTRALSRMNDLLESRVQERTASLEEADQRKDEFLAALAHELRNPLAALRTAAEVYRLKAPPGIGLEMPQGVFDRQLRAMTRLIDELLDVSRITRNLLQLKKESVELRPLVASAIETSRPHLEQKHHALSVDLPEAPVRLEADPVRLSQVISNLLDNAAKYTEPGGDIRLAARVEGEKLVLTVKDNGIGLEEEDLDRVFDLFVQAAGPSWRGSGGLGIGLTLVKRLVEMHGGSVVARSEGSGMGTEFEVELPLHQENTELHESMSQTGDDVTLDGALRVLIVDDNRDAAQALNVMLAAWGQQTRVAYDAPAALESADQFEPHVVLLDIGLPKLHGYDVARRMREKDWGKKALIVAVTGWGQEADRQQSKAAGINHHLIKPVDPDVLKRLLASFSPNEA